MNIKLMAIPAVKGKNSTLQEIALNVGNGSVSNELLIFRMVNRLLPVG